MTNPFDFSAFASANEALPAIRAARPAVPTADLARPATSALHAHWYRDDTGRLACFWHADRH